MAFLGDVSSGLHRRIRRAAEDVASRSIDLVRSAESENLAVSSPKYNELTVILKEVEGLWHKQFGRALPA